MSSHTDVQKLRTAVMLSMQFTSMKPIIFDHANGATGRWTHDDYDEAHAQLNALLAENQRLHDALESAERALADAEKIITSHTGPGSWVGSLNLQKVREALAGDTE